MKINEIKNIIEEEKILYVPNNHLFNKLIHHKRYMIWKCLASFRLAQFYGEELKSQSSNIVRKSYCKIMYRYYQRQKNIFGERTNIEIANHSKLGRRLQIWHGGVIISANIGDDCSIHGNNVLGNKGGTKGFDIPKVGNHVDIGVGAVIIGGIYIADDCVIGANAMVNKNFFNCGKVIVGIPAIEYANV